MVKICFSISINKMDKLIIRSVLPCSELSEVVTSSAKVEECDATKSDSDLHSHVRVALVLTVYCQNKGVENGKKTIINYFVKSLLTKTFLTTHYYGGNTSTP